MKKQIAKLIKNLRSFLPPILFLETIVGISLSLGSFLVFIKLRNEIFEKELTVFDNLIWQFFYRIRNPQLTKIMIVISHLGGEAVIISVITLVIFFLIKKHYRELFFLASLLIMSVVISHGLKLITQRSRPDIAPLITVNNYSFPSGHAMNSFVFYTAIAYLVFQKFRNLKLSLIISSIAGVLILLIGISRIYLGVHYATDVIAGYIMGFWWLVTVIVLEKTLIIFKIFKNSLKDE